MRNGTRWTPILVLWTAAALMTLPATASAAAVTVTFCATYKVDYEDADLLATYNEDYEGDYFYSNSNKLARGASIQVVPSSGQSQALFADWTGANAGCAGPFYLDTQETYDVRIRSESSVNGNTIKVRKEVDNPIIWFSTALSSWSPSASGTVNIETANTHRAWNVAAAAGHALWRRTGGLVNKTFDLFTDYDACDLPGETDCDPCGNGTGSCMRGGDVHLSMDNGVTHRFIIVHELGHALEHFAAGGTAPKAYGSAKGACYTVFDRAHEMQSKEWQSAAIGEGWAHFYAAVAFNQTQESNCGFVYYKSQDYDLDGTVDGSDPHAMSCEQGVNNLFGDPPPSPPEIDAKDYLGDFCSGTLTDRGTELDWMRFWWDLLSDEGVAFSDCLQIYQHAILGTTGQGVQCVGDWDEAPSGGFNCNRPYVRMEDAASYLGFSTEWSNQLSNGVNR